MKTPLLATLAILPCLTASGFELASPDGQLVARVELDDAGSLRYSLSRDGRVVVQPSRLGLVREDADYSQGFEMVAEPELSDVADDYQIAIAKRRSNSYRARRAVLRFRTAEERNLELILQLSDDGLGFRYHIPDTDPEERPFVSEATTFRFAEGSEAWLQPMARARTGWANTNPSYEEHYKQGIPVGTPSPIGVGWVFPALFRSGGDWVLLSEAAPQRDYCGARLSHESPEGEYGIAYPDPREAVFGGPATPVSALPWTSPWRLVVVGDLKTITESMLGVDLAEPAADGAVSPEPGIASWSWPLLGDRSCNFDTQKRFIDYAADMQWRYTLIDAQWDQQIGDERMKELVEYAKGKDVEILVWLNSAGDWNESHQTPRNELLSEDGREQTFKRLAEMGIAGVKIDFFPGDGQSVVNYQIDVIEAAARHGLSVNYHGTTLPRGLQRTYPNFMTAEAIKGLEFITFGQGDADLAPSHAAMLPFTRNVFDPMDFTPMVLDRLNDRVERRTTSAFELALPVLFTSGIQHIAEIPAGMAKAPDEVRDFLRILPASWDDSRFLEGFPGRHVAMARRSGERWFVGGINGTDKPHSFEWTFAEAGGAEGRLFTDEDGAPLGLASEKVSLAADGSFRLEVPARGGFVLALD